MRQLVLLYVVQPDILLLYHYVESSIANMSAVFRWLYKILMVIIVGVESLFACDVFILSCALIVYSPVQ